MRSTPEVEGLLRQLAKVRIARAGNRAGDAHDDEQYVQVVFRDEHAGGHAQHAGEHRQDAYPKQDSDVYGDRSVAQQPEYEPTGYRHDERADQGDQENEQEFRHVSRLTRNGSRCPTP